REYCVICFFFSSRRRHTRWPRDWSSDVCSSDLQRGNPGLGAVTEPMLLYSSNGDQAGSEAKFAVGIACSLRPVRSTENRCGPPEIGRASCRERVEVAEVAG